MTSRAGNVAVGLVAVLLGACSSGAPEPNVLLITLDTTRADHVGCYGYGRDTTPNLDALAAAAERWTNAIAPSTWTLPSHASLFTGKFPSSHGAHYTPEGNLDLRQALPTNDDYGRFRARGLARDERTLADRLRAAGWSTAGFVAGPWLKRAIGLDRGFEHWDDRHIEALNGRPATDVTDAVIAWLDARADDRPFFAFVNYFDPHEPFQPPGEFLDVFRTAADRRSPNTRSDVVARYDGEIRYMDHHLGRLLDDLRARGLWGSTWIIVTADHGQLLGEHASADVPEGLYGHGEHPPYQELVHVPLVIKPPGAAAPRVVDEAVQLLDLPVMILERVGVATPADAQGQVPPIDHPILAENLPLATFAERGHWRAWFCAPWKLLWNSRGEHELFDLSDDPTERRNRIVQEPDRAAELVAGLERYLAELPPPGPLDDRRRIDAETEKALESLGYLPGEDD